MHIAIEPFSLRNSRGVSGGRKLRAGCQGVASIDLRVVNQGWGRVLERVLQGATLQLLV